MRRIEEETPAQTQRSIRRILEEIQASHRSESGRFQIHHPGRLDYRQSGDIEHKRLIEEDQAWQRDFNRTMSLPVWETRERFYFVKDSNVDGDVAYLTDLRIAGEPIGLPSPRRIDERPKHNRILLTYDKDIAAIEFFNVSEGIDLRGLTESSKVKKQLADSVNIILDPSRKPIRNLTTSI